MWWSLAKRVSELRLQLVDLRQKQEKRFDQLTNEIRNLQLDLEEYRAGHHILSARVSKLESEVYSEKPTKDTSL